MNYVYQSPEDKKVEREHEHWTVMIGFPQFFHFCEEETVMIQQPFSVHKQCFHPFETVSS